MTMTVTERVELVGAALSAAAQTVERQYRLVYVKPPFRQGDQYGHIAANAGHLSLCGAIAVTRPETYPPLKLEAVECPDCLRAFVKRCGA